MTIFSFMKLSPACRFLQTDLADLKVTEDKSKWSRVHCLKEPSSGHLHWTAYCAHVHILTQFGVVLHDTVLTDSEVNVHAFLLKKRKGVQHENKKNGHKWSLN